MNEYIRTADKICEDEKKRDGHSVSMIMALDIAIALEEYHKSDLHEDDRGNEP